MDGPVVVVVVSGPPARERPAAASNLSQSPAGSGVSWLALTRLSGLPLDEGAARRADRPDAKSSADESSREVAEFAAHDPATLPIYLLDEEHSSPFWKSRQPGTYVLDATGVLTFMDVGEGISLRASQACIAAAVRRVQPR